MSQQLLCTLYTIACEWKGLFPSFLLMNLGESVKAVWMITIWNLLKSKLWTIAIVNVCVSFGSGANNNSIMVCYWTIAYLSGKILLQAHIPIRCCCHVCNSRLVSRSCFVMVLDLACFQSECIHNITLSWAVNFFVYGECHGYNIISDIVILLTIW